MKKGHRDWPCFLILQSVFLLKPNFAKFKIVAKESFLKNIKSSNHLKYSKKKFWPSAFSFALILTFVTILSALAFTSLDLMDIIASWGDKFWSLNKFAMEMSLILIIGSSIALSPFFNHLIEKMIKKHFDREAKAVLGIFTLSTICCLLNWGFGLIIASVLVMKVLSRFQNNNGLIIASGYGGFLFWHGGLSGSIPLKLTSPSNEIQSILGNTHINLSDTIFSNLNLVLILVNYVVIFILLLYFLKKSEATANLLQGTLKDESAIDKKLTSDFIESHKLMAICLLVLFCLYFYQTFFIQKKALSLSNLTLIFLFFSILLNGNLAEFKKNFHSSVTNCSGIILQFPFYAGIMGVITKSGLGVLMSESFLITTEHNFFLILTYLSAGVLNFFVPSGGGQWVIQAPIILPMAKELGISLAQTSMAIAWGDAWSNMIQPFWALPILGMTGVSLGELMKYTSIIFLVSGISTFCIFAIMI